MPTLTPQDIANPQRHSGFNHVNSAKGGSKPNSSNATWAPKWRATVGSTCSSAKASAAARQRAWRGPARMTPLEAAQDYCDHINGLGVAAPVVLKTAGNNATRASLPRNPELEHALGVMRDFRAQRRGVQGYVYLIVETEPGGAEHYAKIGYSTNPAARVGELQTGNPRPLRLAGKIKGTEADETAMHAKYIRHNTLQEWFWLTDEIRAEFGIPTASVARVV